MTGSRPKALVTAAVSGPGLDLLHQLADLVLDSWLDQPTLRIYNATQLAERVATEGASIVIVESDSCGPELYEQPIIAVCSCRGDPTNVDVAAATAAGVPVLRAPGRNADAVAELAVALLLAATRGVLYHLDGNVAPTAKNTAHLRWPWRQHFTGVPTELADSLVAYLECASGTRTRSTVLGMAGRLGHFARFLTTHDPALTSLAGLDRQRHIEPYLAAVARASGFTISDSTSGSDGSRSRSG